MLESGLNRESEEFDQAELEVSRRKRAFKRARRDWERKYWDGIIEEASEAAGRHDWGKMYKVLKKLGLRHNKSTATSEAFTAEKFKTHFAKVSENRNEQQQFEELISSIPERPSVH